MCVYCSITVQYCICYCVLNVYVCVTYCIKCSSFGSSYYSLGMHHSQPMFSHGLCNSYSQPMVRILCHSYSSWHWLTLRFLLNSYISQQQLLWLSPDEKYIRRKAKADCPVAQAATDILGVSKEAIEKLVTSEMEETLLQHITTIEKQFYKLVSKGVIGKVQKGHTPQRWKKLWSVRAIYRDPYILLMVVCAP